MRRGLGRGRLLIGLGAVLAVMGTLLPLPWYTVGGEVLPAIRGYGLDGAGVLVFVAGVGMLAVLALPYATRSRQSSLDRPAVFTALTLGGLAGLILDIATSFNEGWLGPPDRAPGLWLAGAGMALATWGTAELFAERPGPR